MGNDCATGHACFRSTCSSVRCEARESAWIERETGDVPVSVRNVDHVVWGVPHNSFPALWLDDLAQRDPEVALAFVLMGATGQEGAVIGVEE